MPMQAQRGGGSLAPTHSQPGTRKAYVVNATPRQLYARERALVPIVQAARCASGSVWTSWNISPPPGVDPRSVQPVASPYTNYATPALRV